MRPTTQILIGTALMAGGGSSVATILGREPWGSAALVCFALGIVAISTAAVRRLAARVAQLERDLTALRAAGGVSGAS